MSEASEQFVWLPGVKDSEARRMLDDALAAWKSNTIDKITVLPAPLCLVCGTPIFDMSSSNDSLTRDLVVVLRCHGETETVRIGAAALASCPNIWTTGVLATAFGPQP